MAVSILVTDPNLEFAESVRQVLEGTGRYVVLLAKNGAEAIRVAGARPVRLAIVNSVLPDLGAPQVVRQLRILCPGLAVVAIPSKTGTEDGDLLGVGIDEFLPRLVYLPDLPWIVERVLVGEEGGKLGPLYASEALPPPPPPTEPGLKIPAWLLDQRRATDYLSRLIAMSPALASVLTLGNRLWAAEGSLSQPQFDELTLLVAGTSASSPGRGALARFVRLTGASAHLQLYSTEVLGDLLLSMVFPANVPFGQVRLLARNVAATLSTIDPGGGEREPEAPEAEVEETPEQAATPLVSLPRDWLPTQPMELKVLPFLAPSNGPGQGDGAARAARKETAAPPPQPLEIPRDWLPRRSLPIAQLPFLAPQQAELPTLPPTSHETPSTVDQIDWISYTIVLVPRLPDHSLSAALTDNLARWTERLCLAWDWRLDHLDLKPAYLSLTISLPPDVAPAGAVRLLIDSLSRQVTRAFPELGRDLPSGRFWARSYMLVAGPPSPERVARFIRQTRQAQGLKG